MGGKLQLIEKEINGFKITVEEKVLAGGGRAVGWMIEREDERIDWGLEMNLTVSEAMDMVGLSMASLAGKLVEAG